jgi:hypothetical protein
MGNLGRLYDRVFPPSINDPPTTSSPLHLAVPTIRQRFWVTRHVPSRHWDIQHLKSTSRVSPSPKTTTKCKLTYKFIYPLEVLGAPDTLVAAPTQGLEILFLMHPIATGITFAVTILTFFMNTRDMTLAALILSVLGGGAATFAFAADVAFVVVAKQQVNKLTPGTVYNSVGKCCVDGMLGLVTFLAVFNIYPAAICWLVAGVGCYRHHFRKSFLWAQASMSFIGCGTKLISFISQKI